MYLIFFSNFVFAFDQEATYLVLNHFDESLPNIDQSLIDNFNKKILEDKSLKTVMLPIRDGISLTLKL